MKTKVLFVIGAALLTFACTTTTQKNIHSEKELSENTKLYSIPDNVVPVWEGVNGFTAEQALKYRQDYSATGLLQAAGLGSYASANISEVLPMATVHRMGEVAMLEEELLPQINEVVATTDLGTMSLRDMLKDERSRMKGIAVIHKGKVVFEDYVGMREWDNHVWASAAKSLNGLLIHQLEEEGMIDLEKTVGFYLPQLENTAWNDVTVANVLHQRSGLDVCEGKMGEPGHPTTLFYGTFAGSDELPEDASFMESVRKAGKIREQGELFEYSSINTYVLGMIIEKVTEKPFHDVVTERIWSKAGMEGDALLGLSPSGEPSAFGVFSSRLRDLGRYGMLYTPSWNVVASEQVVSDSYFPKVYASSDPSLFKGNNLGDRMVAGFGDVGMGESYQWDAVFPDGDLYKSGRTGQCLYISPETDTVVVWFSSTYESSLWVHAYAREIVKQMFR